MAAFQVMMAAQAAINKTVALEERAEAAEVFLARLDRRCDGHEAAGAGVEKLCAGMVRHEAALLQASLSIRIEEGIARALNARSTNDEGAARKDIQAEVKEAVQAAGAESARELARLAGELAGIRELVEAFRAERSRGEPAEAEVETPVTGDSDQAPDPVLGGDIATGAVKSTTVVVIDGMEYCLENGMEHSLVV